MSIAKEKKFLNLLSDQYLQATPGLKIQVYQSGRKQMDLEIGKTYKYYDLASLTKVLFSASLFMKLHDEKKIKLNSKIQSVLPWYPKNHTIKDLFTHSAGLTWWKPYYKEIDQSLSPELRFLQLEQIISHSPIIDENNLTKKSVYSDLDLFILGFYVTHLTQKTLQELWFENKEFLGFKEIDFIPFHHKRKNHKLFAPTENCPWRNKIVQAEVHDENTWALGGVAPHAGLFGTIDELSEWGLKLRKSILSKNCKHFPSSQTVRLFTKRSVPKTVGDWAVGFMMPTKGVASCGKYFSMQSVGHTGFTGTSIWYDPKQDLLVSILSNRVHPTRENKNFIQLRPKLHDWICEVL